MKKWIPILGGLLAVQLVLILVFNLAGEEHGAFQPQEKLLVFEPQAVDRVLIEEGSNSLLLIKQEGKWVLPESADFPADQKGVEQLLNKLAGLEKGWPVADTEGAAKRFQVAEDQFERKLTLLSEGNQLAQLYIGSSQGVRKTHARPVDEESVFAVTFNSWEAGASSDDWVAKDILAVDRGDLVRIEMPGILLSRNDDGDFRVADLAAAEATDTPAVGTLLSRLAGLQIQGVLGVAPKPEYGQEEPVLEIKVSRKSGDSLSYRFSKPENETHYVLKRSDMDQYFKVAEFTVKPLQEMSRGKLVRVKAQEAADASPAAGDK